MLIIFVLIFIILITFIIGNYFFNMALNPKISKKYINRELVANVKSKEILESKKWIEEFGTEKEIISENNFKLHGYKVKNPIKKSDIWVILIHGYMGCGYELVKSSKKFIDMGYNIFLIDLRAHGKSEGKYIGMGWNDKNDLILWIDKLCNEEKNCKIILYGVSMGASTVMMASGEKLNKSVKLCIEDCGYTSVSEEFKSILKNINPIIRNYILFSSNIVTKIKNGYFYNEASCIKQIKKSSLPTLFIHGEDDTFVPYKMFEKIYSAKSNPKEKLTIKNAGHAKCSIIEPEVYWNKIETFIKKYID